MNEVVALHMPAFWRLAVLVSTSILLSSSFRLQELSLGEVDGNEANASFGTKLCLTSVHAWIKFHDACPVEGDPGYDLLGCGLGKTVLGGDARVANVVSSRKVTFGAGTLLTQENIPSLLCIPGFTIPIPDLCARGIVADIMELYVKQNVSYSLDGTLRLNPFRLSSRCKKSKDHYIAKLQMSGTRNCWGPALDFKAMYCAFYGGIEAYQQGSRSGRGSCSTAECCRAGREQVRTLLAPYLSGDVTGNTNMGILEKLIGEKLG